MKLSERALRGGRIQSQDDADNDDIVDIITFVESPWGLNNRLFPVQRVILKALYGLELNDTVPDVSVSDFRREHWEHYTEAGYLRYLFEDGRCNISEVIPGKQKQTMVLAVGRRSGKTFITTCICAYETYKMIKRYDPQAYFGLPPSEVIQIISVATDKDQAGLLYQGVKGHYLRCPFFVPYVANMTQTFATFQTPKDIEVYGAYAESDSKKASIKATFRSCVAEGLRGAGNILAIMDEMAHFGEAGSSSADEVLTALKPSIAAFSPKDQEDKTKPIGPVEAKLIAISSPLGKAGTFYELYQSGKTADLVDTFLCIQAPTWEVNPTIEASFLIGEYQANATKFATEFGAEFSNRTRGWIDPAEDLLACIDPFARPKTQAPARMPHFIGIDLGLVNDGTAVAIGHADTQGRVVVDYVDQIQAGVGKYSHKVRLDLDDVCDWIYDLSKRFYLVEGIFDQWTGIAFEQALAKKGLTRLKSKHMTQNLVSEVYQTFKDMMNDRRLVLYDWPKPDGPDGHQHCPVITELLELQAEYKSKYITLVQAPQIKGKHDDLPDALVRMVWLATQSLSRYTPLIHGQGRSLLTPVDAMLAHRNNAFRNKASGSSPERMIPRRPNPFGRR